MSVDESTRLEWMWRGNPLKNFSWPERYRVCYFTVLFNGDQTLRPIYRTNTHIT